MVPVAVGVTTMVTVKLVLAARLGTEHVTVCAVWGHATPGGSITVAIVTPGGSVSVMTTLVAGWLPTLITVAVSVRLLPRITESGVAVVMTVRSGELLTVTGPLEALLSSGVGSGSLPATVAVFWAEPAATAVTRIEMSTIAPLGIAPSEQTTGTDCVHAPWLAVAKANVTVAGSESVTTTPVASPGPLFLTDRL